MNNTLINKRLEKIAINLALSLIVFGYYSPLIISGYYTSRTKDIGQGYCVVEIGKKQIRYGHNGRILIDSNGDGKLDQVCRLMPVGPFMGGPGYYLSSLERTEQDNLDFQRARELYEEFKRVNGLKNNKEE